MKSGVRADQLDLWAPVARDGLPQPLLDALKRKAWAEVKSQLAVVMDGVTTDGSFGRALLQVALELPIGIDPVLDSYHAAAAIDHGDWDALRECVARNPIAPVQLFGMRNILLAPLDQTELPLIEGSNAADYAMYLGGYEPQFSQMGRRFRSWARRMLSYQATELIWSRPDVPASRHIRHRRLQDTMILAFAEIHAGRLPTAMALALEAMHLGDEAEPLRRCAPDVLGLVSSAMGDDRLPTVNLISDLAKPTGVSPLGAWQLLMLFAPLVAIADSDSFLTITVLAERIAARLGSPRAQLLSESWRALAEYVSHPSPQHPELPGLRAQASRAGPGLRVIPQLFTALTSRRLDDFYVAERLARRAGNIWAQVSALVWIAALNPTPRIARWLSMMLEITAWRRPVLVPPDVAADAALGLVSLGLRGQAIVELASVAGRHNVLLDVAVRHLDDTAAPLSSRLAAVEALGTLGTSRAVEILTRTGRRNDALGRRARAVSQSRRRTGLTEREIEVLQQARLGRTNRDIAEQLSLSQHTIARHLQNARTKLGAANRTEAAMKLEELDI